MNEQEVSAIYKSMKGKGKHNVPTVLVFQADVRTTLADGNHRSTAGISVGIAEEDHNFGSGRYRHCIPVV